MKLDVSKDADFLLASALRGPDSSRNGDSAAKNLTTGVVRWFAGVPKNVLGPVVRTPEEAKSFWNNLTCEQQQLVRNFFSHEWHYRSHLSSAYNVLATRLSSAKRKEFNEYREWLRSQGLA